MVIITCSKEEGNRKCEDAVVYCYLLWRRRKQTVWRCSSTLLVLWRRRKQKVWRCSSTLLLAPKERKTESVQMQLYIITCSEGEGNRKCEDAVVYCYLLGRRGKQKVKMQWYIVTCSDSQKVWRCSSTLLFAPKEKETEGVKMQWYSVTCSEAEGNSLKVWRCSGTSLLAPKERETNSQTDVTLKKERIGTEIVKCVQLHQC